MVLVAINGTFQVLCVSMITISTELQTACELIFLAIIIIIPE